MFKKILAGLLLVLAVVIICFVVFVNVSSPTNYSSLYPIEDLQIESSESLIERGAYLVNGPAHCTHCHVPEENLMELEMGTTFPMIGGFGLELPPGTFYAPNITADVKTGIGGLSNGELYRMMRYNINSKGEACFDFMPFANMSEKDIHAVIAYLRTLDPVMHESKEKEMAFLGKAIIALGGIKPAEPDQPILKDVKKEVSIENGRYLAYAVANCRGCHTERDQKTGAYIGEAYAGGFTFGPDNLTKGWTFTAPNLTPDPETGIMTSWSEEDFVRRMEKGRMHPTSPMPWGAFKKMDRDDMRSIYRFLMSLQPVQNQIEVAIEPAN